MKIDGQELISRPTTVSGRTLSTAAIVSLMASYLPINTDGLNVFGATAEPEALPIVGLVVLAFFSVGHALNWNGDRIAFVKWNDGARVGTIGRGSLDQLGDFAKSYDRVLKTAKEREEAERLDIRELERVVRDLKDLEDLKQFTKALTAGVSRLSAYGMFMLYGWHLFMPLGLTAWAMCVLWRSLPPLGLIFTTPA